ncbi:hypothetical protein GCM10028807_32740 [Spirosoma daeguense]
MTRKEIDNMILLSESQIKKLGQTLGEMDRKGEPLATLYYRLWFQLIGHRDLIRWLNQQKADDE